MCYTSVVLNIETDTLAMHFKESTGNSQANFKTCNMQDKKK